MEKLTKEFLKNPVTCNIKISNKFDTFHDFVYFHLDLNAIMANFFGIIFDEYYAADILTARTNIKKYSTDIKLKEIKNGSIKESLIFPLAVGLILIIISNRLDTKDNVQVNIISDNEEVNVLINKTTNSCYNVEDLQNLLENYGFEMFPKNVQQLDRIENKINKLSKKINSLEKRNDKNRGSGRTR